MDDTQDILDSCIQRANKAFQKSAGSAAARDAALYLAHTEMGESLRKIAQAAGKHPSTVMRAVRRVEQNRDDPLYDHVLSSAEAPLERKAQVPANVNSTPKGFESDTTLDMDHVRREARKFLRRLSEPGAFLLIARGADKAGVFCSANEHNRPIAMFPVRIAAEFLRQDWIKAATQGTSSVRYKITEVGRSFLRRTLSEDRGSASAKGFAEAPTPFQTQHREKGERLFANPESGKAEAVEVNLGESPLGWLARRKDANGKPFLTPEEFDAGEKLRCDFEAAQLGPSIAQDWRKFLTPGDRFSGTPVPGAPGQGAMMARDRVMKALAELGPGLADVAMRTCCFLEGLEACERRMGWSARSGKVVLKLALQRLAEHYGLKVFKD